METTLWLWLEGPCHPECMPACWKLAEEEGQACDHFTEMSRMFGHSSVLNKHPWSLHPSLPPCLQCWLRQNIYECLCVGLPICTPTDSVYQQAQCWGLSVSICAWLIICLNVYTSIKYKFGFWCVMSMHGCLHTFIYEYVCKWLRRRMMACGKLVLLRAAVVWTCAAAKKNCGRKSLLIEHEACHLKLESSKTQKPQQAGISAVLY